MKLRPTTASPRRDPDGRMSLGEHISELRSRLFRAALALLVATVGGYICYDPLFRLLERPYCDLPASRTGLDQDACTLYFFHPLDAFTIRVRVAIIAGMLISSPFWLYQLWAFITPGLRKNERRWALTFVSCATGLFVLGAVLAYVTLPKALEFLLGAAGSHAQNLLNLSDYLDFTLQVIFYFGLAFELPLVLVMLNRVRVLPASRLTAWWRPAVFLIFVAAAVITPSTDPITMTVMGGGMTVLYFVAVVIARRNDRRVAAKQAALWASLDSDHRTASGVVAAPDAAGS